MNKIQHAKAKKLLSGMAARGTFDCNDIEKLMSKIEDLDVMQQVYLSAALISPLERARSAKGLTQEQVAVRLGLGGAQSINNWEQGKMPLPTTRFVEIDDILGEGVSAEHHNWFFGKGKTKKFYIEFGKKFKFGWK